MEASHIDRRLVILDHETQKIEQIWPRDFSISDAQVDEEISVFLNTAIRAHPEIDYSSFSVQRATTGYLWKGDKCEKISNYDTDVWKV